MDAISSRWRKPKSRSSKRKQAAINRGKARWSAAKNDDLASESLNNADSESLLQSINEPSTSFTKLQPSNSVSTSSTHLDAYPNYALINMNTWNNLLGNIKCSECQSGKLFVSTGNSFGYSTNLELKCNDCAHIFGSTFTSPRVPQQRQFEVNKKIVEAFLRIGKGHAALEVFSLVLGIQTIDKKTFSRCLNSLADEGKNVKKEIMELSRNIVRQRHEDINPFLKEQSIIDISVSYDGTWHKRGHTSIYGLGIVIDILTGLVIDYEILSKYCPECNAATRDLGEHTPEYEIWKQGHKSMCQKNHEGSSGSMEVNAAAIIWRRSEEECKMRYTTLLSDGDSKTFQMLREIKPYGPDICINKEECINHIAKRLGTGLRNKVKEWREKGICLGGKKPGSLKEVTIVKLTNFYRKAIKDNIPCVEKMKKGIYATLYHCSSTDKKPKHDKCPDGETSWCFYKRALASNVTPKSHKLMKTQVNEVVLEKILPVYQRLASNELLLRCVSGKTQNANESVHSLIWKNCPKETFISKKRLELSVMSSISEFNIGCLRSLEVMDKDADNVSISIAKKRDKRRLNLSIKRNSDSFKVLRKKKKYKRVSKDQKYSKTEGILYKAGMF